MILRYYKADYIDKHGNVRVSYSFQADTNAKALSEANRNKKTLGCEICSSCKTVVILTGKAKIESKPLKPRKRIQKHGINKFNH